MYVQPLKNANPPIIPHERLSTFLHDVFHNYLELYHIHRALLSSLHEIQRDEHPMIRSINAPILDAALNFRDAYTAYIPNNPIAHYRIDEEMQNNPVFKAFADVREILRYTLSPALTPYPVKRPPSNTQTLVGSI